MACADVFDGLILFQQKRYERQRYISNKAIRNDSTLSNVVKEHAGDIYAQTGDMAKAIEFWQKAIDGGNDSATLRKKLKLKKYVVE